MTRKLTKTQKAQYADLAKTTSETIFAFRYATLAKSMLPTDWAEIDASPVPAKTRITLRLDADVAKFYRKLGKGYQETVNGVLRSFMLARLTEMFGEAGLEMLEAKDVGQEIDLEAEAMMRKHLEQIVRRRMGW